MTLDDIALHPKWTVREALNFIREHGYHRETLDVVFVVDATGLSIQFSVADLILHDTLL